MSRRTFVLNYVNLDATDPKKITWPWPLSMTLKINSVLAVAKIYVREKISSSSLKFTWWASKDLCSRVQYSRSRSSKVIDLGVSGKRIGDFLLVINSNPVPISHRFRDTTTYRFKMAIFSTSPLFDTKFENLPRGLDLWNFLTMGAKTSS